MKKLLGAKFFACFIHARKEKIDLKEVAEKLKIPYDILSFSVAFKTRMIILSDNR